MAPTVRTEPGIDRAWLEEVALSDPVSHAWALWDLDHAADRTRFLSLKEGGRSLGYLLIWYGLAAAPVVHWVGAVEHARLLAKELPPRPLIAIAPTAAVAAIQQARAPVVAYPLLVLAFDREAPIPPPSPSLVRRLGGPDRPALSAFARSFPELLTAAYASIDPAREPVFGAFSDGTLVGVARVQVTLPAVWIIGGIYTAPEYRGEGYGRALTATATRAALDAGAKPALAVREDNAPARHIYDTLGYRQVDRRAWIDAGVERRP